MTAMVKSLNLNLSPQKVRGLMEEADPDKSGQIEYDEFVTVLKKQLEGGSGELAVIVTEASSQFGWLNPLSWFGPSEPVAPPASDRARSRRGPRKFPTPTWSPFDTKWSGASSGSSSGSPSRGKRRAAGGGSPENLRKGLPPTPLAQHGPPAAAEVFSARPASPGRLGSPGRSTARSIASTVSTVRPVNIKASQAVILQQNRVTGDGLREVRSRHRSAYARNGVLL